jgi:hypothetical protein
VEMAGCCPNGRKEAVAVAQADAYKKAAACTQAHAICPMIRYNETRIPKCNSGTHLCEMVAK